MIDFTPDVQKIFLEFMLQDAQLFVRVQTIFNPENFDKSLRRAARFIGEHAEKYGTLPERTQLQAVAGTELQVINEINAGHVDWFMEEFENFTRRRELERAILKAADLLEKGDYDPVEKLIKDAVQIGLTRDMGTDYFADPKARLNKIRDNNAQCTTGWPRLDKPLYGGFSRKTLNLFFGGSGSGKSLFLQNLSCNWLLQGLNGVFFTLELSEELCAMRLDAMFTGLGTRELYHELDNVELKVHMIGKKSGGMHFKYFPAQSTINDFRTYLKELQIQKGFKPDFVCVDYLDLMMPCGVKVNASDMFIKDKYVSEELRNFANEQDILLVSASQLNRGSVDEIEYDHADVAGGISKIYTADNILGIYTSRAMRERGKIQLQLMKTRTSAGVGQKIDLDYDVVSMRISDSGLEEDANTPPIGTSSILQQLKPTSKVLTAANNDTSMATVKVDVQANKLKDMLSKLKKKTDE